METINTFFRGCSDHQDQLFCLFELKTFPWPYGQSLGQKRFFRWGLIACRQRCSQERTGNVRRLQQVQICCQGLHLTAACVVQFSTFSSCPFASLSKRVFVRNRCYGNAFHPKLGPALYKEPWTGRAVSHFTLDTELSTSPVRAIRTEVSYLLLVLRTVLTRLIKAVIP